jgi:formyltetrahydrofolate-dependent phosphoribosylglycinamide formyltransferase
VSRLAVLASGNGSNFEALANALRSRPAAAGPMHECVLLIYDRRSAYAAERASRLGIPSRYVTYYQRESAEAEAEIGALLDEAGADIVALAGFMRILSGLFVARRKGRLVNVHPSLLPAWPGAHAIERAYGAGELRFGVTVHQVDEGMDTGAIIVQESFTAEPGESLDAVEARIHELEHRIYPRAVLRLLDDCAARGAKT